MSMMQAAAVKPLLRGDFPIPHQINYSLARADGQAARRLPCGVATLDRSRSTLGPDLSQLDP